jgi:hypothetical protein
MSLFAAPAPRARDQSDHVEVGVFAEYLRMTDVTPTENFVGPGGRAAFHVHLSIQLEAEMGYDFQRSFAQTFTDGVSTELVTSHARRLHGFFGPKFQSGSEPFRVFVTRKVGFENFQRHQR